MKEADKIELMRALLLEIREAIKGSREFAGYVDDIDAAISVTDEAAVGLQTK